MKSNFKNSANDLTDKRGKKISIDDECCVDFPASTKFHGQKGIVSKINPDSVELNFGRFSSSNFLPSLLVRTKEAHETADYRLTKRSGNNRHGSRTSRGGTDYYGRPLNLDSLGNDQSNPAIGDALMRALDKVKRGGPGGS